MAEAKHSAVAMQNTKKVEAALRCRALTKTGANTLFLTGANTYTGTNTLTLGVVNLGVAETVGISGPLGKSAAANAGNIFLGGGTPTFTDPGALACLIAALPPAD